MQLLQGLMQVEDSLAEVSLVMMDRIQIDTRTGGLDRITDLQRQLVGPLITRLRFIKPVHLFQEQIALIQVIVSLHYRSRPPRQQPEDRAIFLQGILGMTNRPIDKCLDRKTVAQGRGIVCKKSQLSVQLDIVHRGADIARLRFSKRPLVQKDNAISRIMGILPQQNAERGFLDTFFIIPFDRIDITPLLPAGLDDDYLAGKAVGELNSAIEIAQRLVINRKPLVIITHIPVAARGKRETSARTPRRIDPDRFEVVGDTAVIGLGGIILEHRDTMQQPRIYGIPNISSLLERHAERQHQRELLLLAKPLCLFDMQQAVPDHHRRKGRNRRAAMAKQPSEDADQQYGVKAFDHAC